MTDSTLAPLAWLADLAPACATPNVQRALMLEGARPRLALALLDCVVRDVLPLALEAQRFEAEALELRAVDSLVSVAQASELALTLRALEGRVAANGMAFHRALGSAARGVEDLLEVPVDDTLAPAGPLEMALRRAVAAGAPEPAVRVLLERVLESFVAGTSARAPATL